MKFIQSYIVGFAALILVSCSTKKNTLVSRTYHNISAHYNVYFNGNESYKKGIKRLTLNYKDDYTTLLPVFPFPNAETTATPPSEMERAIKKSAKTISLHSITAKPNFKKGIKTKRQKELYNKKEYNNWIDDAYLLIGKSNVIKNDMYASNGAFRQILKEYPKENTVYETQIWLCRTLNLKEEFNESEETLTKLSKDKKFPKKLIPFLNATFADFYIRKKKFDEAIPKLEIAAKKARDKSSRLRYTFILGQLYQQTGQMNLATEKYLKVIKMSPPYEMTFNARINLAGSFESGSSNADQIRKQLYKLLDDEKNKDYQDQIYFALANIDLKEGNKPKAIENYTLSAQKSVNNQKQKAKSYLAIADISYADREYFKAQAYYDSAITNLDEAYPDYSKVYARSKSLTRLASNINMVSLQDSVQFIAKMSENERNLFIDNIIAKVKEKEAEDLRKQQQEQAEQQQNMYAADEMKQRSSAVGANQGLEGSKWYFYSPSAKGYGQTEFQMKWGKRKLEDNWRRSKKKVSGLSDTDSETADAEKEKDNKKKGLSNKTREFYMEDLPITDSLLAVSHKKIRRALYESGAIYRDELNEHALSAKQYQEIINRYPSDAMVADAAYQLYILNRQLNKTEKAEEYKTLLITKFPESVYAKLLTNPEFLKELQERENAVGNLYKSAYADYESGNAQSAFDKASEGVSKYSNHVLASKFAFLKVLSNGKMTNAETLRSGLMSFIKDYPKAEETQAAKDIMDVMDVQHPEAKEIAEKEVAKEMYKAVNVADKHYFAIVINPKKANQNQLVFNLINYNLDNYTNSNLSVKTESLGATNQMVVVREFKNKTEAMNYFNNAKSDASTLKDVGSVITMFVINDTNFNLLKQDGAENLYFKFFQENYINQ